MNRIQALVAVSVLVVGLLMAGCGTMPQPTEMPLTQTPYIIIITATADPARVAEAQPTQTPWIIVATATAGAQKTNTPPPTPTTSPETTSQATSTPSPEESAVPPPPEVPTNTPEPGAIKYPQPDLADPPSEGLVPWNGTVLLKWDSVGELADDEFYHLHLERPPKSEAVEWWGDYVYTKDTEHLLDGTFLAPFHYSAEHGRATVYWWVRVVRQTGQDDNGKPTGTDVSPHSERRTLILESKPAGQ